MREPAGDLGANRVTVQPVRVCSDRHLICGLTIPPYADAACLLRWRRVQRRTTGPNLLPSHPSWRLRRQRRRRDEHQGVRRLERRLQDATATSLFLVLHDYYSRQEEMSRV